MKGNEVNEHIKTSLWGQFGAAIDFLKISIDACPDDLWHEPLWQPPEDAPEFAQFWYVAFHTLFWLDLYLTGAEEGFEPPAPFSLIEMEADAPPPEPAYTRAQLMDYLTACREKTHTAIMALTEETATRRCEFGWGTCTYLELMMYNMRHVHGHASQLNMLLGQHGVAVRSWVAQAGQG